MWSVYKRMAELTSKKVLSDDEQLELKMCLEANKNLVAKMVRLENLSVAASLTDDHEWQHEICREVEALQNKLLGVKLKK